MITMICRKLDNVLLGVENGRKVAKLADFGLLKVSLQSYHGELAFEKINGTPFVVVALV